MALQRVPNDLKTKMSTLKHTLNYTTHTNKDKTRGGLMNEIMDVAPYGL